jgi:hypothetical protein
LSDQRTSTERKLAAQVGAHARWAVEPDRPAATAKARAALDARFGREVDPDGLLSAEERAKRAGNARNAYFKRMALASVKARRLKATG